MATLVVDGYEGPYVSILHVPGAYLNADTPSEKCARLKLEGELMDIMCDMNPDLIPNIW